MKIQGKATKSYKKQKYCISKLKQLFLKGTKFLLCIFILSSFNEMRFNYKAGTQEERQTASKQLPNKQKSLVSIKKIKMNQVYQVHDPLSVLLHHLLSPAEPIRSW